MNRRRFIISAAIVFIVVEILDYIIHQIILQSTYMVLRSVLRPEAEMQSKRWIVFVTALIWPFLFVYIYTKGMREGKWWRGSATDCGSGFFLYSNGL